MISISIPWYILIPLLPFVGAAMEHAFTGQDRLDRTVSFIVSLAIMFFIYLVDTSRHRANEEASPEDEDAVDVEKKA